MSRVEYTRRINEVVDNLDSKSADFLQRLYQLKTVVDDAISNDLDFTVSVISCTPDQTIDINSSTPLIRGRGRGYDYGESGIDINSCDPLPIDRIEMINRD